MYTVIIFNSYSKECILRKSLSKKDHADLFFDGMYSVFELVTNHSLYPFKLYDESNMKELKGLGFVDE